MHIPFFLSTHHKDTNTLIPFHTLVLHMARLNSLLLITLLVLVCYSPVLDARKILKIETQQMLSLKGTLPSIEATSYVKRGSARHVAHLANEEVVSNPSPGQGHK